MQPYMFKLDFPLSQTKQADIPKALIIMQGKVHGDCLLFEGVIVGVFWITCMIRNRSSCPFVLPVRVVNNFTQIKPVNCQCKLLKNCKEDNYKQDYIFYYFNC